MLARANVPHAVDESCERPNGDRVTLVSFDDPPHTFLFGADGALCSEGP
jgi:hypothetical protein